jgi:hypothetical protein
MINKTGIEDKINKILQKMNVNDDDKGSQLL